MIKKLFFMYIAGIAFQSYATHIHHHIYHPTCYIKETTDIIVHEDCFYNKVTKKIMDFLVGASIGTFTGSSCAYLERRGFFPLVFPLTWLIFMKLRNGLASTLEDNQKLDQNSIISDTAWVFDWLSYCYQYTQYNSYIRYQS